MKKTFYTTITTKYLPATNTLGARVSASFRGWSATISWDDMVDDFENFKRAVGALAKKHEITVLYNAKLCYGTHENGYYFVFAEKVTRMTYSFQKKEEIT